jgi:TldD protein
MIMKRRDFLGHVASGGAILTVPGFIAGCGMQRVADVTAAAPDNPFMEWFGVDQAMLARVMSELTANGADAAELYFQHSRSNTLALEDGVVADATSGIEQGLGLRVVIGEQTGYAFTEDLTAASMLAAARDSAAIASGGRLFTPQSFDPQAQGELYSTAVQWSDVGVDEKLPLLEFIETRARAIEPSVEKVSVYLADGDDRVMIATLDGSLVTDRRPMTRATVLITARKGQQVQTGFANIAAREEIGWYSEQRLTALVQEAVDRTMMLFDARRAPAGEMPVILAAGASGILLHEAIGHGMEADFNRNGISPYSEMIGKRVAEPFVTVVDQATLPHERGALNYDDEGNRTGRTVLVEDGVLTSYLHDGISARYYGATPTGSGRRQSYKFPPLPRMTCTFMDGGPHSRDEIIAAVDHGVICETYTDGRVKIGGGDFTFFVRNGWLVENGKVTSPVKDFSITGNGPQALARMSMVADDARLDAGGWTCGKNGQNVPVSQGIPTVLVSGLAVGNARPG